MHDSQDSPGEWFDCINVGDDYEDKDIRRKDKDLSIPGQSLIEIVGVRTISEEKVAYEIRLPFSRSSDDLDSVFISSNWNYAFTGPGDILKGYPGRMRFAPAWCRFKGSGEIADTQRIHGRYDPTTSSRQSTGGSISSDNIFNQGGVTQLGGDPRGHLKLPDLTKGEFITSGWNALGIYKVRTGNKKEDNKAEENLLAYVAPASQANSGAIMFITTETINQTDFDVNAKRVEFLQYIDPSWPNWNQKYLIDWQGIYGHQFEWEIVDNSNNVSDPLTIISTAEEVKAALEKFDWVGEGNVEVYSASANQGGRWIVEFVGSLSGKLVPMLYKQRIIRVPSSSPGGINEGASWNYSDPPPIAQTECPSFNFKPIAGSQHVIFSSVVKSSDWYRYYYGYGNWYGAYGNFGYYYSGPYGYYGGYYGGPFSLFDANYNGYIDPNLAGPYGYYSDYYRGPYYYNAVGTYVGPGGDYNALGYDESGYDADGYNPAGFDADGLDSDGKAYGYYGRWGHFHTSVAHDHKNDHGVQFHGGPDQQIPAGSFGVAVNVGGSGYVAVGIEDRIIFIDTVGAAAV